MSEVAHGDRTAPGKADFVPQVAAGDRWQGFGARWRVEVAVSDFWWETQ